MTKDEAMQIAMDALNNFDKGNHGMRWQVPVIEALCTALAQPKQEPVAWAYKVNNTWEQLSFIEPPNDAYDDDSLVPLYTAPPQRKPLSDEQIEDVFFDMGQYAKVDLKEFARAIEAAHGIRK